MRLRSLLFVPGDRPDRMEKALGAGADALILDLEDAVAAEKKSEARRAVAAFVAANPASGLWVRINPLEGPEADRDLAAILPNHPHGIVLPKAEGGASVTELTRRLTAKGYRSIEMRGESKGGSRDDDYHERHGDGRDDRRAWRGRRVVPAVVRR